MSVYHSREEVQKMKNEIAEQQKIYIDQLDTDELTKVWNANEKLRDAVMQEMYEDNMNAQYNLGELLLKGCDKYYEMRDHYSSFYLRLIDGVEFIRHINFKTLLDYDIISYKESKEYNDLIAVYENNYEVARSVIETLESYSRLILNRVEKMLHDYEDYPTNEDALDYFLDAEVDCYSNCYIVNDGSYVMYEVYTRCYK